MNRPYDNILIWRCRFHGSFCYGIYIKVSPVS